MAFRIIFAGTPLFAIPSLQALMDSQHQVLAVYTKADSPSGRGLKLTNSPIKQYVLDHYSDIPILQPVNLKDADTQRELSNFLADIMVVIAYGLILPKEVLSLFKYGCINVHASLLPRWRGAAPIQRAILAGDKETGVTIMQMDEGLDTGDMLGSKTYQLNAKDTFKSVHDELSALGAQALLEILDKLETNEVQGQLQNNSLSTYASKINKEEAQINWHTPAIQIDRQIRAFNSWPIAYSYLFNQLLKIWQAEIISTTIAPDLPGRVLEISEKGMDIATLQGIIRLLTIQMPGGKPVSIANFLCGREGSRIIPGKTLLGEKYADYS
jgi:methionyl-tRNA formyltransferase